MLQDEISIGRGGDDVLVNLALYTNDEVSREHLRVRRDAARGGFLIVDNSMNGTWLNGKRSDARPGREATGPSRDRRGRSADAPLRGQTMMAPWRTHSCVPRSQSCTPGVRECEHGRKSAALPSVTWA